jgi:hypothetical protein
MIVDTSANRNPVQRAQSVILRDESIIRAFDEVRDGRPLNAQPKIVLQSILAERSQNGQYFQRRGLNAALTAAVRPFDALATLLLRPICGPCD